MELVGTLNKRPIKRRWLEMVRPEMQAIGVLEEDAADGRKWKRVIQCGSLVYRKYTKKERFVALSPCCL